MTLLLMLVALMSCNNDKKYPELEDLRQKKFKLKATVKKPEISKTDIEELIKEKEEMKNAEI